MRGLVTRFNMKKTILPVILFLSLCTLHGCKKGSCDSGSFVLEERGITAIREIILYDHINLVIYQDSTEKLMVDAGEHMQGDIETFVAGHVLTLRNNSSCNWLRDPSEKITVTIYTKDL